MIDFHGSTGYGQAFTDSIAGDWGGKPLEDLQKGLATFTALQRRGIPSRFLYFPDENHWVLKPANSILWHETVLGWMDRWLKQPGGGTSAQQ